MTDVHPHRRSTDPDDGKSHVLQNIVENSFAKFVARYGMPLLLGVMAWQGRAALDDLATQRNDIAQLKSDVRVIGTRLDEGIVRQVNENAQRITDIDHRVQVLERGAKP